MNTKLYDGLMVESTPASVRNTINYLIASKIPTVVTEPHLSTLVRITERLLRGFSANIIFKPRVRLYVDNNLLSLLQVINADRY